MVNRNVLQGNWDEIKGKLRQHWGQLTNDELQSFNGDVEQLVGLIERKTGEGRQAVEDYLDRLTARSSQTMHEVQDYVQQAAQRVQERSRQATESFRQGYDQAEDFVRTRPSESVAVCFGVGVFVGLLLGLTMRGR